MSRCHLMTQSVAEGIADMIHARYPSHAVTSLPSYEAENAYVIRLIPPSCVSITLNDLLDVAEFLSNKGTT